MKQWNQGLIGKVFYELDPSDKNKFRTVRVGWNGFANKMVLQYSNAGDNYFNKKELIAMLT